MIHSTSGRQGQEKVNKHREVVFFSAPSYSSFFTFHCRGYNIRSLCGGRQVVTERTALKGRRMHTPPTATAATQYDGIEIKMLTTNI